jgi:4-hydroxybenzoate polyprenyltransferase
MLSNIIKTIRIKQWVKNFFVFGPIVFSRHLFEFAYIKYSIIAFFAFCCLSSVVYIVNDILDKDTDKLHPEKKKRPIAAGTISVQTAVFILIIFLFLGIYLTSFLNGYFWIASASYLVLNLAYSLLLKHIVILDVFSLAGCFILRVVGGAVAIEVDASPWLIICTLFISLFLGFAKRRGEIITLGTENQNITRKVLADYDIHFLDIMLMLTASGMAISYSLYTVSERTTREINSENLIYTTIFVLYGIFRYLYLSIRKNQGEDTAQMLIKDMPLIINILLWVLSCVLILYQSTIFSRV